jgi:hypothetical protein
MRITGGFIIIHLVAGIQQQAQDPDLQHGAPSQPFDQSFDDVVRETIAIFPVPGFSIAIVNGNQTYQKVGI